MNRNWREMDTDVLDAPPGWEWDIDDELAHHVWRQTTNMPEVTWGPDPPLLIKAFMGFDEDKNLTDTDNNWFFTRDSESSPESHTDWEQIPTPFSMELQGGSTAQLMDESATPHPLWVRVNGEQYTKTGARFVYRFNQWQGESPSGFAVIPVHHQHIEAIRARVAGMPFTEVEFSRMPYSEDVVDGQTPLGSYSQPQFRADDDTTKEDYKELLDVAFEYMRKAVGVETAHQ